ncbi:hypothetical protein J4403_01640 [Candidatus Woesearchaeota archaeon]|nr:hypothetical protein [Candidatus Woesearchaeota archaeon]
MSKKLFIFGVILIIFSSCLVTADVIPSGQKGISYCFRIENLDAYPEYTFLIYSTGTSKGHEIISQNSCIYFYKLSLPSIYAIKTSEFEKLNLNSTEDESKFFSSNNINLLKSDIALTYNSLTDEDNPLNAMEDIFTVSSIDNKFEIKKSKIVYIYEDKTQEILPYTSQSERPKPTRVADNYLLSIILSAVALLIIIGIIIFKSKKNKK